MRLSLMGHFGLQREGPTRGLKGSKRSGWSGLVRSFSVPNQERAWGHTGFNSDLQASGLVTRQLLRRAYPFSGNEAGYKQAFYRNAV